MNPSTLDQIGEIIMPRLEIENFVGDAEYAEKIKALVREHKAGGFCVFSASPEALVRTIFELQEIAKKSHGTPLIFSADCEFGLPMRFADTGTEFPEAMAMAKTGDPKLVFEAAKAIAKEMRSLGLAWNFAPVADVNSNPINPIINIRSFGENPEIVEKFAAPFMLAMQSEGVAATAKHFPGHGDTSTDSHRELPSINKSWEEFNLVELPPFEYLIREGVMSVMTGHLAAPELSKHLCATPETRDLPATLSRTLTDDLLRGSMGFEGVIVTDALEMHAITKYFGEAEAAVLAFEAGADVLLMPHDPDQAFAAIEEAVSSGRIPFAEIEKRISRINRLKLRTAIESSIIGSERLNEFSYKHAKLAEEIARKAISVDGKIDVRGAKLLIVSDDRPEALKKAKAFSELMRQAVTNVEISTPNKWAERSTNNPLLAGELDTDTIVAVFHRARGYIGGDSAAESIPKIIAEIAASLAGRNIALRGIVLIGSPYLGETFQSNPGFTIKTYSESLASVRAASDKLQFVHQ
jgi:beta-N-acetylhexosaminidase